MGNFINDRRVVPNAGNSNYYGRSYYYTGNKFCVHCLSCLVFLIFILTANNLFTTLGHFERGSLIKIAITSPVVWSPLNLKLKAASMPFLIILLYSSTKTF